MAQLREKVVRVRVADTRFVFDQKTASGEYMLLPTLSA